MARKLSRGSLSLAAGGVALAGAAAFLAWILGFEGSRGLAAWGYRGVFLGVGALGALPLLLALAGLGLGRTGRAGPAGFLAVAGTLLACLVAAGLLAGSVGLATAARKLTLPLPPLALVKPSEGIVPGGPEGPDGPVLRLSISSDPHWGAASAAAGERRRILEGVAAARPARDAFFILGDNVEDGWKEEAWREEALELSATLGDLPVRPLLGNHDALLGGQRHYRDYFLPAGAEGDSPSPWYWAIDAGPATIVAIHLLWGAEEFDAAQRAWLERTLEALPRERPVIVLSHCFLPSSGYVDEDTGMPWYDHFGTIPAVAPLLAARGVDLVVSGHNHYMELLGMDGVTYATAGAMGGKPDPVPVHVSPWSTWFRRGTYGRLDLDVDASGISLRFVGADGTTLREAWIPAAR